MALALLNVQVTSDGVPVVYHDFLVMLKGENVAVQDLTCEQLMAACNRQFPEATDQRRQSTGIVGNDAEVDGTSHQTEDISKSPRWKANYEMNNIHKPIITLEELFRNLESSVELNIEIKYPMLFEADALNMGTHALELNHFLDTILLVVFEHSGPKRKIIFSSFSPEVCMLLAVKQPIYPIVFLNDSSIEPTGDPRAVSTQTAVHFARQFGLSGVAMAAEPFVLAPGLITYVKDRGLFTMSYGALNDQAKAAQVQAKAGLDAIIVNEVKKIVELLEKSGSRMPNTPASLPKDL
ncbi:hypothetical protein S40288_09991 [Stachybotrys chartarum IBT 40288]|nr:hypothetical protein S40288_09991 [Stachybotrys chartarum IBT 40288]